MKQTCQFKAMLALLLSILLCGCAASGNPSGPTAQTARDRVQVAEAMFQERCKTAGEKIYRTADNVEGVFLMKLRPEKFNFGDQFTLDDPYGQDATGERYLIDFVGGFSRPPKERNPNAPPHNGFRYVEAIDPKDGKRYRYTGSIKVTGRMDPTAPNVQVDLKRNPNFDLNIYRFVLEHAPTLGAMPRYGVTYEDISTHEEREYWIAGSSLKVIDLQTNEVMAERIGYMMDRGHGSKSGGRSPWLLAADHACPDFHRFLDPVVAIPGSSAQSGQTLDFVEKVLKPKLTQGE